MGSSLGQELSPHEPGSVPLIGVGRKELLRQLHSKTQAVHRKGLNTEHWRKAMGRGAGEKAEEARCTETAGAFNRPHSVSATVQGAWGVRVIAG